MRNLSVFTSQAVFVSLLILWLASAAPAPAQLQVGGTIKLPTQAQFLNCLDTMGGPGGTAAGVCLRPANGLRQPVGDFGLPTEKPPMPTR